MVSYRVIARMAALLVLAGCASIRNDPVNQPVSDVVAAATVGRNDPSHADDLLIGLSFSGGGTRAAAFSFGVLSEFARIHVRSGQSTVSLIDHLDFVSGVSGGSGSMARDNPPRRGSARTYPDLVQDRRMQAQTSCALLGRSQFVVAARA